MSQAFQYQKDVQGTPSGNLPQSVNMFSCSLLAAGTQSFTVPSTYSQWALILKYGSASDVWVSDGHTAAAPAGNTFASTNSQLNPPGLQVAAGDVISFYNNGSATADISASLYGIK